jgi:hypothetical protein
LFYGFDEGELIGIEFIIYLLAVIGAGSVVWIVAEWLKIPNMEYELMVMPLKFSRELRDFDNRQ